MRRDEDGAPLRKLSARREGLRRYFEVEDAVSSYHGFRSEAGGPDAFDRQGPLVEDIRTVEKTGCETGGGRQYAGLLCEAGLTSRGQALDAVDAKGVEKANSRSDLTAGLSDTPGPQFHAAGETPRQERDLVELDELPSLEVGSGYLPDDQDLWGYIRHYDQDTGSTSSDLALRPKVRGWVENDRSMYFLHEIGVL